MKKYRILKREGDETEFYPISDELFTQEEVNGVFSMMLRASIVMNESHKGNPILVTNLHSPEVPSIPNVEIFVTFEEVE